MSPSNGTSSSRPRIFSFILHPVTGIWGKSEVSTSQAAATRSTMTVTATRSSTPPPPVVQVPAPVYAVDTFIGGSLPARRQVAPPYTSAPDVSGRPSTSTPPPYAPPGHTVVSEDGVYYAHEPPTLARYLFLYGFMFPPFWIVGACILLSTLRAPDSWSDKSEDEKRLLLEEMRRTEVKWARRCLVAIAVLLTTLALAVAVAVLVHKK